MLFDGYKLIRVWLGGLQINHGTIAALAKRSGHIKAEIRFGC